MSLRAAPAALAAACLCAANGVAGDAPRTYPSPAHVRVFAPPARASAYRFERSDQPLDEIVRFYRERWPAADPRSWRVERLAATEAFDGAALFDRARLARLYGGRHPRVARGPVTRDGEVFQVVLLMSPYPEPDLRRLNPGTLIMGVTVDPDGPPSALESVRWQLNPL